MVVVVSFLFADLFYLEGKFSIIVRDCRKIEYLGGD